MPTPTGLREQKKLSTRAALIEQAMHLAAERGYDGFTIADLVDSVGVSRRTFSNYFAGKAECLAAISDSWMDGALAVMDGMPAGTPLTGLLREVLSNLSEQIADSQAAFQAMTDAEPELAAAMAACELAHGERVAQVIAARTNISPDDIRLSVLAEFAISAGRACIRRWVRRGRAGGRESLALDLDRAFSLIDFDRLTSPA